MKTNHIVFVKFFFFLCIFIANCGVMWGDSYNGTFSKISSMEDFTTGYYVVTGSESSTTNNKALGAIVDENKRMPGVAVTIADNIITNPDNSVVWYVEVTKGTNTTCSFRNVSNNKYLCQSSTTSGKGMGLSDSEVTITCVSYNNESPFGFKFLLNGNTNNLLKWNNSNLWFANYSNSYSTSMSTVRLFKLGQSYSLTAVSNNDNYGTVSVSGNVITANPADGFRVSTSNPYTVTSGVAEVSQNNNVFTVTAEADCTVQINFESIPGYLPVPVITVDDVIMTWGESGKKVSVIATIGGDAYDGPISYTSSSENLTVTADGILACNVPGNYTVTVTITASETHQAAEQTCTVLVNKKDAILTFTDEIVELLASNGTYTQTANVEPEAYDGTVTYAISSSTSDGVVIDDLTAELLFENVGVIVVTATASSTELYNGTSASYTLYLKQIPVIEVSDAAVPYGSTFTVDDSMIEGGEITVTSANTAVAIVDGLTITPQAVGHVEVTVSTAANAVYDAGEESFILTVTAPEGLSESPSTTPEVIFYESFDGNNSTGGNDGKWSGSIASGTAVFDNTGWGMDKTNGGKNCIKIATGSASGYVRTPSLNLESDITYQLSFKAAAWNATNEKTTLSLKASSPTKLDVSSVTTVKGEWTTYNVAVTKGSENTTITFTASSGGRAFLDEVTLTKPATGSMTVTATVASSGYGTYCCDYPLNLDALDPSVKAYVVAGVEGNTVTFTQLTGTIKGGVPFILYGAEGNYDLTVADASITVPVSNLLAGTLAPTYVSTVDGDYTNFGLSKGAFVMLKDGTLPAHKAYLPLLTSGLPDAGTRLSIVFDDDYVTGIHEQSSAFSKGGDAVFDLQGRRVVKPAKGLYIINGKKMFK